MKVPNTHVAMLYLILSMFEGLVHVGRVHTAPQQLQEYDTELL